MSIQELSKSLVGDVRSVLEGKKLDPVGKADADIDNDGDVDSSDEYLKKRRKAIGQAMKDEGNAFTKALMAAKEKGEKDFVVSGKKYHVKEVEEFEKDKNKKDIKELDKEKMKKDMKESLIPLIEKYGLELINEIIGSLGARIPDAGKDSSGIRKAVGKDDGGSKDSDSDGGMDNREKVGYNALKSLYKKYYKALDDEENAEDNDEEERAKDMVIKLRSQIDSKAKFYRDATVKKAREDARG